MEAKDRDCVNGYFSHIAGYNSFYLMLQMCIPHRLDLRLGKAYNEAMRLINDDDHLLLYDYDVLPLLPETKRHIAEYVETYPTVDVFTCYTNRSHKNSTQQMLNGVISDNTDIVYHIERAQEQTKYLHQITEVYGNISGFLMVISKRLWKEIPFVEHGRCLGVDTTFSQQLRQKGKRVYRMDGVYVFHIYRLINGVLNKDHLTKIAV